MKRVLPYISLTLAFLVVALVANVAMDRGIHTASGTTAFTPPQAWFSNPFRVDSGVYARGALDVSVRVGSSHAVSWEVLDAGHTLSSGTIVDPHAGSAVLHVSTARARYHTWLYIYVAGTRVPLQVWII